MSFEDNPKGGGGWVGGGDGWVGYNHLGISKRRSTKEAQMRISYGVAFSDPLSVRTWATGGFRRDVARKIDSTLTKL